MDTTIRTLILSLAITCLTACGGGGSSTAPLAIDAANLATPVTTRAYTDGFSAAGGTAPFTWALSGTVPGLNLATNGTLAGTPTEAGTFSVTVSVTDTAGRTSTADVSVLVVDPELAVARFTKSTRFAGATEEVLQFEIAVTAVTATAQAERAEMTYYNQDGSVDERTNLNYEYDANGYLSAITYADEADVTTRRIEYDNDAAGNTTEQRDDWTGDSVVNRSTYKTFDTNGDVTHSYVETRQNDGSYNREHDTTLTYGSPTRFTTRTIDYNADGVVDFYDEWQYDPNNPNREIHIDEDSLNAADEPYNLNNGGPDGIFDREMWVTWTDHPDGTVTRWLERDLDRDGDVDRTDLRVILNGGDYAPFDRRQFSTLYEQDTNADGTPELRRVREFNSADQVTLYRIEQAANNYVNEETFTYDTEGKPMLKVTTSTSNRPENDYVSTLTAEYVDWTIGAIEMPGLFIFDDD